MHFGLIRGEVGLVARVGVTTLFRSFIYLL